MDMDIGPNEEKSLSALPSEDNSLDPADEMIGIMDADLAKSDELSDETISDMVTKNASSPAPHSPNGRRRGPAALAQRLPIVSLACAFCHKVRPAFSTLSEAQ